MDVIAALAAVSSIRDCVGLDVATDINTEWVIAPGQEATLRANLISCFEHPPKDQGTIEMFNYVWGELFDLKVVHLKNGKYLFQPLE